VDSLAIATVIGAIASYFICGIPFGFLIAAKMSGIDVRRAGSGNIGMTNVARTAGGKAAALTFGCDVGKGALCVVLFRWLIAMFCLGGDVATLAHNGPFAWVGSTLFMACVLGHVFSPYLHFKGGKGIAVGLGASLGFYWPIGLCALGVFILLVIPTRYISLGSIAAAISMPIFSFVWGVRGPSLIPVVILSIVVVWSHRENIGRLVRGEERKFSIRHKKDGEK
jgi:glycerol-3-phosphate acyltransferase PlsY